MMCVHCVIIKVMVSQSPLLVQINFMTGCHVHAHLFPKLLLSTFSYSSVAVQSHPFLWSIFFKNQATKLPFLCQAGRIILSMHLVICHITLMHTIYCTGTGETWRCDLNIVSFILPLISCKLLICREKSFLFYTKVSMIKRVSPQMAIMNFFYES